MPRHDFNAALRQADQVLATVAMPAETDRRIKERLGLVRSKAAEVRRFRVRAWEVGALAAGVLGVAVLIATSGIMQPKGLGPTQLAGFLVRETSPNFAGRVAPDQTVEVLAGAGVLVDKQEGISLAVLGPSALRREDRGLRLARGTFRVTVDKRPKGERPARLLVSHGAIEVLGTRFMVIQRDNDGSVFLSEGAIRFVSTDGRAVKLSPGEALNWPLAPEARAPEPKKPPHKVRGDRFREPTRGFEVESVLDRIASLRSRGLYQDAVREIEQALERPLSQASRERLSYELGSILSHHVADRGRACAHWSAHARQYPNGRYKPEIEEMERQLGCPKEQR